MRRITRRSHRLGAVAVLLAIVGLSRTARAQDQAQLNANLQELTQRRAETQQEYQYWQAVMADPNVLFVLLPTSQGAFPFPMTRDEAAEYILHLSMTDNLRTRGQGMTVAQLTANWIAFTQAWKDQIRNGFLPVIANDLAAIDRDIQATRNQLAQIGNQPQRPPYQPLQPTPAPGGIGWKLANISVGTDGPLGRDITLVDRNATTEGGYISMRYRVHHDCFETWRMSWTFGQQVSYLRAGDRIPVTLRTDLVEGACGSPLAASVGIAAPRLEGFVAQALQAAGGNLNQIEGSVRAETGEAAKAMGAVNPPYAQVQDAIIVERNPLRFPSFELVRIYAYVPGQFLVASYLFQGQSGEEIGMGLHGAVFSRP